MGQMIKLQNICKRITYLSSLAQSPARGKGCLQQSRHQQVIGHVRCRSPRLKAERYADPKGTRGLAFLTCAIVLRDQHRRARPRSDQARCNGNMAV